MLILLTGASGFVGRAILKKGENQSDIVIRPVYRSISLTNGKSEAVVVTNHDSKANWSLALNDVDVVIHAAAITQNINLSTLDLLAEYRRVNVDGTVNLARQAAFAGVRRFIFISSIKVNGESTVLGRPFTANDTPAPEDCYAFSKAEAETQLIELAKETGMEVTIIRPPLVYGPGVKGNFASLISLIRRGLPLPLGGILNNKRSIVSVDNLVDLIFICAHHPKAGNQTFLVSDGEDLSTTEIVSKISEVLELPPRLFRAPASFIYFIASLMGKKTTIQRLFGTLQVDIEKTCELLDWRPSVTVVEGLRKALE
jgi:nucleoside-diphosphate-sugar epimerase